MALKFPWKQSQEINLLDFTSHLLELVTLVIVINDVIGGFSRLRGLKMIGSCRCLIKVGRNRRLQPTAQLHFAD